MWISSNVISSFICSVNAKDIGVLYLISSIFGGILGFSYSMIISIELSNSGNIFLSSGEHYNTCITLHGLIMIFFFVMPFLISGIGNYFVRIMLGQIDMCFPSLNNISFWLWLFSLFLLLTSGIIDYGANGGWTLYVRLSTLDYSSSTSVDVLIFSLLMAGISSLLGSINFITTIINNKHSSIGLIEIRILLWCLFITNILLLLSLRVLAVAITFILTDSNINTTFYNGNYGGDPIMYQHLFWIFGLPEVHPSLFASHNCSLSFLQLNPYFPAFLPSFSQLNPFFPYFLICLFAYFLPSSLPYHNWTLSFLITTEPFLPSYNCSLC